VLILPATGRSVGAVVLAGALFLMTGVGYRLI